MPPSHTGGRPGDSGSPALDASARVIGVFVRHLEYPDTSSSKDVLVYESLDSAGDWLKAGAAHAAEVGGYEPAPWVAGWPTDPAYSLPIGGPCDETCPSGLCSGDECTRTATTLRLARKTTPASPMNAASTCVNRSVTSRPAEAAAPAAMHAPTTPIRTAARLPPHQRGALCSGSRWPVSSGRFSSGVRGLDQGRAPRAHSAALRLPYAPWRRTLVRSSQALTAGVVGTRMPRASRRARPTTSTSPRSRSRARRSSARRTP
jgi:hypothetical protein